ncbi:MAG: N-acetylglucosamine-6-phosphate deacetylase [Acidimicrobiales bacterium]|nr:N-acetylglucosamine-6-phosphate deacetylase [Acidimicrobiales bacterium]
MSDAVLRGGRVLGPEGWWDGDLALVHGRVAVGPPTDAQEHDVRGLLVVPGLVDLQCNGGIGIDLASTPERLWELGAALTRWGVTAWAPTIVSTPVGVVDRALAALQAGPPEGWVGAVPVGLHLEGPFLAPARRGAHPRGLLRTPSLTEAAGWSREGGVAIVTLAPELPGALELIADLAGRGVVVSIGHSDADAAVAEAAVEAGAAWVTHLFNAMAPLHHRGPGLVGVALTDERLHVGVIADGVHVAARVVDLAWRAAGPRLTLVTDAVAALGQPPGVHRLGNAEIVVTETDVRLADGTLAGSKLSLDQAVRNLIGMTGCSVAAAVQAASASPAALLDDPSRGTLAPGARADVAVLTPDLEVVATLVAGEVAYAAPGGPFA